MMIFEFSHSVRLQNYSVIQLPSDYTVADLLTRYMNIQVPLVFSGPTV